MAKPRRCNGKTRSGNACKAPPLKGKRYCSAHDPVSPAFARFGSRAQAREAGLLGGRPPTPRVVDVLRARVEAEVEAIIAPYFDAIKHSVLHSQFEGKVILSEHPDLAGRIAAAERLLDRVYGKPRQTIEHAGPQDGGGIPVEFRLDARAREAIAGALRKRPAGS